MIDRNVPTENQDGNFVYPTAFLSDKDDAEQEVEKVCSFKPSPAIATDIIIERGKAALSRLEHDEQTWPNWCAACAALLAVQTLAMTAAQTNKPEGPRYRQAMKHFLVCHGFDHIHKSTRSLMCEVARNIAAIEIWRSKLPANELLELNHPRIVLKHWKRSFRPGSDQSESEQESAEANPFIDGWNKSSPEQRTAGLVTVGFNNFRQDMPDAWCKPMKDCAARLLAEDRDPDFRMTRAIQKALEHIEIADDPKTSEPLGQGHEKEALDELRVALKALRAMKRRVHELDVGISTASKAKRRSS